MSFNVPFKDMKWSQGSNVGIMSTQVDVLQLQKMLYHVGHFSIKVTPMGGEMVLITADGNDKVHSLLEEVVESLEI